VTLLVSGPGCLNRPGTLIPSATGKPNPVFYNLGFQVSTSVPGAVTAYTGPITLGLVFTPLTSALFIYGYYVYVCPINQPLTGVKCCLWSMSSSTAGVVVPGSVVTGPTLTPGHWNYIPLTTPAPISIGDTLIAAVGYTCASGQGFPDIAHWFSNTQVYQNGPLLAYGGGNTGATYPNGGYIATNNIFQSPYNTASADPTSAPPSTASTYDSYCIDVNVGTEPSYAGPTWRLWPNMASSGDWYTALDDNQDYEIATEIRFSRSVNVHWLWFYSPPTATSLPTAVDIWQILDSGLSGTLRWGNTTPAWLLPSGSAASPAAGWIKVAVNQTVPPGRYRAGVYNGAGTSGAWGPKRLGYWGWAPAVPTGGGISSANGAWATNGISWGPISAPSTPNASVCFSYQPPSGTPVEPGQSPFAFGPPDAYPNLYVGAQSTAGNLYQNYWVDLEVA
jgi:hypothetical protein